MADLPFSATQWPAVSPLLDEALDLAQPERADWLDRLNREHPELATIIRTLLAAHARSETDDFLEQGPALSPGAPEAIAEPADALNGGDVIGPYRLLRPLGSGGMALVWLARRIDASPARDVALKIPQRYVWRQGLAERFTRERDILARLAHPHIARLYDAGVSAPDGPGAGLPYLVLEYVQGSSLTAYCDTHRLGTTQRLALMLQVLEAVQYAHARLVIHRDLKPANILVTEEGQVRLLDFGVAKLLADAEGAEDAERTQLTQLTGRAFTPDYASPEQVRGEPLGTASDVYSLGVVLYELLCGQRPYRLAHASVAQLEQAIVEVEPAPPSSHVTSASAECRNTTSRRLQRELRGELDTILLKALKKKPEQRYATVAELAEDLRRHRDGEPVLARPESRLYRLSKFVVRNRFAVGASGLVAAALVAGTAVSLWQARAAQVQAMRALAVQGFMTDIFRTNSDAQADPVKARQTTARELLDIGARRIDANFEADPQGRADVLRLLGDLYYELGLDGQSADFYGRRVEALKQAFGARDARVAAALSRYAKQLDGLDRGIEQRRALDEAKVILDSLGDADSEVRGEWLDAMATAHANSEPELGYAERAAEIFRRRQPGSIDFAQVLSRVGMARWRRQDNAGAELALHEVLAVLEKDPQSPPSAAIIALLTLADAQANQAKIADAEHSYRLAMDKTLARNGPAHQDTLHVQARLGGLLHRTSRRAEGRRLLDGVLAQSRQGTYGADALRSYDQRVVTALLAEGRFDAAEPLVDALMASYRNMPGGPSPLIVNGLRLQAEQRLGQGRYAEAERAADEAWAIVSKDMRPGERRPGAAAMALVRAQIALAQGDATAALRRLEGLPRPGTDASLTLRLEDARLQAVRADALLRLGRDADALQTAQAAADVVQGSNQRNYYAWVEAETLLPLGRALRRAGQVASACAVLGQGVTLRSTTDDARSPLLAETEGALADCLLDAGDRPRAIELIDRARARLSPQTRPVPHIDAPLAATAARLRAPTASNAPRRPT